MAFRCFKCYEEKYFLCIRHVKKRNILDMLVQCQSRYYNIKDFLSVSCRFKAHVPAFAPLQHLKCFAVGGQGSG